jgi:hypothetical protein
MPRFSAQKTPIFPADPEGRGTSEQEVQVTSPVAVTKLFIDDDFIVTGLADGTMKLYDRDQRAFLAQLNIIPVAARGNAPTTEEGAPKSDSAYLQHKVSFLARQDDLMIATMLDPSGTIPPGELRQLELSIWPIRGQNVVQPLKSKLLPGTVNFVHYDERNTRLLALTQYNRTAPHSPNFGAASNSIANGGPLIGITWRPPFKSLMVSGIKWRETNDQLQAKLAQEVMEKVLLEPSFFRAMFHVESDPEEIEQVVESMFISLAARDTLHTQFVDTAISQEIILRRGGNVQASNSSPSLSHSTPLDSPTPPPKRQSNSISMSTSSIPKDSPSKENLSGGAKSEAAAPPQYFPPHAMTTSVLTKCLAEHAYNYISAVLAKPLATMLKSDISALIFNLPSTQTTAEDQPVISSIIKVTAGIIDGLIEHQGKISASLQRLLTSVHGAVCADNPSDSELRSFRRGAARVFLDYVVLTFWLEPVEYHLVSKIPDEVRHNLRVVAQLLQVICGYSKHKLVDPGLCSLVTEYSTKWRSWLLSRVSEKGDAKAKSGKERKANLSRGNSFVASKSGNNKTAGMVVTKFIITHAQDLLQVMSRASRSVDPCATRIRALSESLLMPVMSMMAKKGNKNTRLAASLNVFGRSGSLPASSGTSLNSSTSDSTTVSSESNEYGAGGNDESTESEGVLREGSEASPMRPRKKKKSARKESASASNPTGSAPGLGNLLDSGSEGPVIVSDGTGSNISSESGSGTLSRKSSRSPRPTKHKRRNSNPRTVSKRISSGSLTSSTVEEADEDILMLPSLSLLNKRPIGIVGEVEAALPTEQFVSPSESISRESSTTELSTTPEPISESISREALTMNTSSPTPEPSPSTKKRKPRTKPAPTIPHEVHSTR